MVLLCARTVKVLSYWIINILVPIFLYVIILITVLIWVITAVMSYWIIHSIVPLAFPARNHGKYLHVDIIPVNIYMYMVMSHEFHGITNHQQLDSYLDNFFLQANNKETSKLCITGPVSSEFPSERTSNVETINMLWNHHWHCKITCNPQPHEWFTVWFRTQRFCIMLTWIFSLS